MRRLLRILFRSLKWTGLTLSTLLLIGTVVLWVRSLEHEERWVIREFEDSQEWPWLSFMHYRCVRITHGRIWLEVAVLLGRRGFGGFDHVRQPVSAMRAQDEFHTTFVVEHPRRPIKHGWRWQFAGVGSTYQCDGRPLPPGEPREQVFRLALPFWLLALQFGLWPFLFVTVRLLAAVFRKKRFRKGLCPQCGYDLRATPDPAGPRLPRCPECGRMADT